MDDQLTLRIPRSLAQALRRRAKERRVPKSQLVREALERYLSAPSSAATGGQSTWERVAPFVGSVRLDFEAAERDPIAQQILRHNWRE